MTDAAKINRRRLAFLFWVLVGTFYFVSATNWITAEMTDREFGEYIQSATNLIVRQQRSHEELRGLLMAKARELEIPLEPVDVTITGAAFDPQVNVSYDVIIEFPLIPQAAYSRRFEHSVIYRPFL